MSFGYLQGQEAQALAYYKKLLESQPDQNVRRELEELIVKLEKIVEEQKGQMPPGIMQHAAAI